MFASLIIASLILTSLIIWLGYRYLRNSRTAKDHFSGPVLRIQEELMLTADSAIDRMDGKMAQIEILLEELDRRGRLISQQIERQQSLQNQIEIQRKQMSDWLLQQQQKLDMEFENRRLIIESLAHNPMTVYTPPAVAQIPVAPRPRKISTLKKTEDQPLDKRSMILKLAEEGLSDTEIAQKIGIGKGEVTLLLKLRKK